MPVLLFPAAALFVPAAAFVIFRYVRRDYLTHGRLTLPMTALQVLVFLLHAALLELSVHDTDWPKLENTSYPFALGLVCAGIGLGLLLAGFGVFGSVGRVLGRRADQLKQQGIYRWSRNPQAVGYGLLLLAFLIIWPSWQVGVSVLVYAVIAHRMVLVEEEHLKRTHGASYKWYCERTPRYLGIPGSG